MYCVLDAPSIVHCHFLSWVLHLFKRLVLGSARSSEDLTWKLCSTYQNDHTEFASAPSSAALDASSSLRVSILCGTFISSSPPVAVAGSREVPHGEENINLPVPKGYWWHPIIYKPKALLLSREDACVSWTDHLCICQVDGWKRLIAYRVPIPPRNFLSYITRFPLWYRPERPGIIVEDLDIALYPRGERGNTSIFYRHQISISVLATWSLRTGLGKRPFFCFSPFANSLAFDRSQCKVARWFSLLF